MAEKQINACTPITCKTAANQLKRRVPYGWDLNVYRGCVHGCRYCYAMYTHEHMDEGKNFHQDIYVKTNIAEQLERQLAAPTWKRDIINLGSVTDNYQPAEAEYKLMPELLKLLIRYKTPAIISTKSSLVLRDFDLIDQLSRITYVNIAASVITADEELRKQLEPGFSPVMERFQVLSEFHKTNASTGLHCMPIIPYLTDTAENFNELFGRAKECWVDYALPGTLYLRGKSKPVFMSFTQANFPKTYEKLKALYKTGGAGKEYKEQMYKVLNHYRDKYGLSSSYTKPMKEKLAQQAKPEQLMMPGV